MPDCHHTYPKTDSVRYSLADNHLVCITSFEKNVVPIFFVSFLTKFGNNWLITSRFLVRQHGA